MPSSKENNHKQMNILCALMRNRVTYKGETRHGGAHMCVLGFGSLVIFGNAVFFCYEKEKNPGTREKDGVYNAIKESRSIPIYFGARSINSILFNLRSP